jgi:hypothetical protein
MSTLRRPAPAPRPAAMSSTDSASGGEEPPAPSGAAVRPAYGLRAGGPASSSGSQGFSVDGMYIKDLTRVTWALTQFEWRPPAVWLAGAMRAYVSQIR